MNSDTSQETGSFGAGDQLGRYQIVRKLGQGGMGEVYAANDPQLNREVAIKVLPSDLPDREMLVHRFEREAQAIAKLEHPNIVTIYSVERENGVEFLTMQLVAGETLRHRIDQGGAAGYEFFDLAIQMTDAVAAAHQNGVIHRDLKPENILVTPEGRVMILDFGLSKLLEERHDKTRLLDPGRITQDGVIMGTMDYMSPEQAEGRDVDHRSDIFSMAILLFELVSGQHPFKGVSTLSVLSSILRDNPMSLVDLNPKTPPFLQDALFLAMEKNPESRTQSMKDLRNQLQSLKAQSQVIHPVAPVRRAKKPLWVGLLSGVALGFLAAVPFLEKGPEVSTVVTFGQMTRVAGTAESELHPAVSPSGKMVAYVRGRRGQYKLYVKHVGGGHAVALTAQYEGNHLWPRWSPDESQISFESKGRRWTTSPFPDDRRPLEGCEGSGGMDWSHDGRQVVFVRDSSIILRDVNGTEEKVLVTCHEPSSPAFSPDGRQVAYVSGNQSYLFARFYQGNIAPSAICAVDVQGGESRVLVPNDSLAMCPTWLDARHLMFLSDRHGGTDLYLLELNEDGTPARPAQRTTAGLNAQSFTMSMNRKLIAFCEATATGNVWKTPVPPAGDVGSNRDSQQVTAGSQVVEGLGVSRDGAFLTFDSNRDGSQDIFSLGLPDGEQRQLTVHPAAEFIPRYSPDGTKIAFHSFRTGNRDIFVMNSDGTGVTQVTTSELQERYPSWSADGRHIVFQRDDVGKRQLWVISQDGNSSKWGRERQLTETNSGPADWSPVNDQVAYGFNTLVRVIDAKGGAQKDVGGLEQVFASEPMVQWSADGAYLYIKGWDAEGQTQIWRAPSEDLVARKLIQFDDPTRETARPEFAVGKSHVYFTVADHRKDVFVMEVDVRAR